MSPDKHAILGGAPGVENLYLINGSSGMAMQKMKAASLADLVSMAARLRLPAPVSTTPARA